MKLRDGRTLYYGKGDVLTYRTYAAPLVVAPIPESPYCGESNVVFAHNVTFSVSSEVLLGSFSEGDNTHVVATDSMKNFILRHAAAYDGCTTEGFLAFVSEAFLAQYPHVTDIEIAADRIPFQTISIGGEAGFNESELVFRRSHNEHSHASLQMKRAADTGAVVVGHCSGIVDVQLIKVSGSSFYGFIRDEYTTLPESYDRPLFIFLNLHWRYSKVADALDGNGGGYVAAEQVRDLAQHVFHSVQSPSIQYLVCQIGLRLLTRFPQLEEVSFESNNRTWETIVERDPVTGAGVYTEPRPPFGFQGFSLSRVDLEREDFLKALAANPSAKSVASP
ncbi:factor-independent urate hydroxylase [Paenibacillus sp. CF384]|uniref:factor-independent urate hydroxylase n=1 Tax=Paenibacillus sp. CF384 TaxID=1884382 RepID=UPI000896FBB5|nr:urate oxidase [Paenibacillus sp. CF384]SDX78782.1 urate oxidase [Paenibacillus sp. CF384]